MAWRKARGKRPEIWKWTAESQELSGQWLGSHPGVYGLLGRILTSAGETVTFSMPSVLVDRLENMKEGTLISIRYLGPGKTRAGGQVKLYNVEYDDETGGEVEPETVQREAEHPEGEEPEPEDWRSTVPVKNEVLH